MKTKKLLEGSHRQWMATSRIKTQSPFKDLFPIDPKKVDAIAAHMQANGFDEAYPIVLRITHESVMRGTHVYNRER